MTRGSDILPERGAQVPHWKAPPYPAHQRMVGRFAILDKLDPQTHGAELFQAYSGRDEVWDFLPYGPFDTEVEFTAWIDTANHLPNHQFYAIKNLDTGKWEGVASYLRIAPENGSIEVGHINFSPSLQATMAATEAMYLMMCRAFKTGYRRYEWKCDALNIPSRRAAQRLGFSYEGVFRQATVVKGRNRDTAWFAIIDSEWLNLREAFENWLSPENHISGRQKRSLHEYTAPIRASSDPFLSI